MVNLTPELPELVYVVISDHQDHYPQICIDAIFYVCSLTLSKAIRNNMNFE